FSRDWIQTCALPISQAYYVRHRTMRHGAKMRTAVTRDPATRRALSAFVKLRRAVNTLSARLNPVLQKDHGVTESQFGVLEALWHLGPMPQARLCEKLLVSGSNLTTVIDNLERSGLVHRGENPDDRR